MFLRGRDDERAALSRHTRPEAQTADEDVETVGRGLREGDPSRATLIADGGSEIGSHLIESRVVRVVADVREHADRREPRAIGVGGAMRDRECGARAGDLEVQEVSAQGLQRFARNVWRGIDLGSVVQHGNDMPS